MALITIPPALASNLAQHILTMQTALGVNVLCIAVQLDTGDIGLVIPAVTKTGLLAELRSIVWVGI